MISTAKRNIQYNKIIEPNPEKDFRGNIVLSVFKGEEQLQHYTICLEKHLGTV